MKKEAQKIFNNEILEFISHYVGTEADLLEQQDKFIVFNQFSINYFYGDYQKKATIQESFCQFLMDNMYPYYSDMIAVLVAAGYPEKQPNGKDWPTDKIEKLFGFGMFSAFKKLLESDLEVDPLYMVHRRRTADDLPYTIKF